MLDRIKKPYQGVFRILGLYWKVYGGWPALIFSPYFHVSIFLTLIMSHFWTNEPWWDVPLSVLPNIIGFALGGYAIWLGFGDEQFRNLISEKSEANAYSPYLEVSATFAHFILVQLLALMLALIAKATCLHLYQFQSAYKFLLHVGFPVGYFHGTIRPVISTIFYGVSFLIFVYALMTAVAATLAVFRVANWFDRFKNAKK